jgi:hypothetical protein
MRALTRAVGPRAPIAQPNRRALDRLGDRVHNARRHAVARQEQGARRGRRRVDAGDEADGGVRATHPRGRHARTGQAGERQGHPRAGAVLPGARSSHASREPGRGDSGAALAGPSGLRRRWRDRSRRAGHRGGGPGAARPLAGTPRRRHRGECRRRPRPGRDRRLERSVGDDFTLQLRGVAREHAIIDAR